MNGISHKQAVQWIHRRLDGLLDEGQLSALDEHLHSCEFCRTYAAELDSLPAELQSKFHARWDGESGRPRKVMEYVTTRARKIHVSKRISSGLTLLAGTLALIALAVGINFVISRLQNISPATNPTEAVDSADRLLAFTSNQNGNFDIYTMYADGSEMTNLTNDPAMDTSPFWSPDGKRIAFETGRDGFEQIYLMNADGSDVVQLTTDEADHRFVNFVNDFSPWSPDGSRLIFSETLPRQDNWKLYVIDVNGENKTPIVNEPNIYSAISWSPDGQHIALQADDPRSLGGTRLYVVNADGSDLREATGSLQQNQQLSSSDYYWSPDGQSIFFIAFFQKTDPYWTAYEFNLSDNSLLEHAASNTPMYGWWNGISLLNDFGTRSPFIWKRPDGTSSTLDPHEKCEQFDASQSGGYIQRSPTGNWIVGAYCPNGDTWFYWANSDGTVIKPLFTSPLRITNNIHSTISWSDDDRFIAFTVSSAGENDLYVWNVSKALNDSSIQPVILTKSFGASWQPSRTEDIAREESTPQPPSTASTEGLLAFTSDQNGNFDIYTMRADGSGLTNLTNHPAVDTDPVWSPDGKRIAFQSDRDGFQQIYSVNADGSNVVQLTKDQMDHALMHYMNEFSPWSPDGTRLLISGALPGEDTWQRYVLDVNKGSKTLLIKGPNSLSASVISWSPDGQHIALLATNPERYENHIYMVNADGMNIRELTKFFPAEETVFTGDYHWSPDGRSFFFVGMFQKSNYWKAYEARLHDNSLIELATSSDLMYGWWNGTSLVNNFSASAPFEWVRPGGTSSTLNPTENCEHIDLYQSDSTVTRSPNGSWVVTGQCANGDTWLYWANSDGTQIKRLLDSPISITDTFLIPISWSDDDRFVVFTTNSLSDPGDLYILNVSETLRDPSIQPVKLPNSSLPSWRPVP